MDTTTFYRENPEFESAPEDLVQAAITEAVARLDATAWGSVYERAVGCVAADVLWNSPFGVAMRLDGGDKDLSGRYRDRLAVMRLERITRVMVL